MVAITFKVECSSTKPGEAVFIVGDHPSLGKWDPKAAVPCITTPQVFPNWSSESLTLSADTASIEFKVVVQKADRSAAAKATWEGGVNRKIQIPKDSTAIVVGCVWGKPEVTKTSASGGNDNDEDGDTVGDLGMVRKRSSHRRQTSPLAPAAPMQRQSSRHLCIDSDGHVNADMSRTPSMMLIDLDDFQQDLDEYAKAIEVLEERERLNKMQRRMQSGSLLEQMKEITDYADPNKQFMIQGFNWESWRAGGGDWYSVIGSKAQLLEDMGFTDIWLPPCSASVAPQGYLPSQLFNLDASKYGTQASLEGLLKKLKEHGVRGVADIVVNHRCGDKQDGQGRWNQFSSGMTTRPSFAGVMDWGGWAITLGDRFSDGTGQHGPADMDGRFDAAPDIDHRNKKVQEGINIWLRWLRLQVGFEAWRFDFVKGYGAEFVGLYCNKSEPAWAVGELWGDMAYDDSGLCHNQDRHRQDLCNWINGTGKRSTAFDFTTKGILQEACRNTQYWRLKDSNGKPPGLIGWMPDYAVTFIDNHDTGSTQRHWPFPDDKVLVGYAYIITHPGIPSIFWDHVMDWGEDHRRRIADLMKARRESGIPVNAPVNIQCADDSLYLAEIGSPPMLRVALGPRNAGDPNMNYWSNGPSGNHYRIWVKKVEEPKPPPKTEPEVKKVEEPKPSPKAQPEAKKQTPAPAAKEKEASPPIESFESVTVNGKKITPESLQSMAVDELQKLQKQLSPVVDATDKVLASKKSDQHGISETSGRRALTSGYPGKKK